MKKPVKQKNGWLISLFLGALSLVFLFPIFLVLINSFKGQFYISDAPFSLPNAQTFSGLDNYKNGVEKVGFISAFGYSLFITVCSVAAIVLFTSMTAWYLMRVKTRGSSALYYLFVFSMIVPFHTFSPIRGPEGNIEYLMHLGKCEGKGRIVGSIDIPGVAGEAFAALSKT